ncbi:pyruvate, phosphate dikinase [Streptomyces sp. GSL17-111]|uniref:pyruvate, phosphate dikinase n=1 Tax=Streptomyces sp. GSL17-111 TaxID=3121596 RepID=UPI0030F4A5AF
MSRYVYDFAEGGRDMADLLGGKGAGLAEMTGLGLPVPPGFTVTTEACRAYLAQGTEPPGLTEELFDRLTALEAATGRTFGDPRTPLLLSVRSGAPRSMPGMMETILDLGVNDAVVAGLARATDDPAFAWDCYRRFVEMFGGTAMGVAAERFRRAREALGPADGPALVDALRRVVRDETGRAVPEDPREQLVAAVRAVFRSWNSERARVYRRRDRIPDDLGTAVNVQMMVYGNLGPRSGTGVAFTRDPATGRPGAYGDYLSGAQGEDVVSGTRDTGSLERLQASDPVSYGTLREHLRTLEAHYRDLCDVEFTVERGELWILQTRVGQRTPEAAFRIADDLVGEGLITPLEGVRRVSGEQLGRLLFPRFDAEAAGEPVARGVPASPGAAVGAVVLDSGTAVERAARGEDVVLVRRETTPDDLPGMIAARAVLTSHGGKTSHAAVVARGMGRACVCGARDLTVDPAARRCTLPDGTVLPEGTVVSVDGSAGTVHLGGLPLVASPLTRYFETGEGGGLADAVARTLDHADAVRRLQVRANADTPEDAARARRFGAQGIGLCRTEHMFLGERRRLIEDLVLAGTDADRERALSALLPLQRADFTALLAAMDGLPVTIRLLDPPLHEFLPDRTRLAVRVAAAEAADRAPDERDVRLYTAVERMHEQNPMLGLRGVRLALVVPGLVATQVRAVAEAVVARRRDGGDPHAEIMVPLVCAAEELRLVREEVDAVLAAVSTESGQRVDCPVGTMIELPRAALTAGRIAAEADFFSFGTNDLTQTTWGLSRDDVEATLLPTYLDRGIVPVSPFEVLDREGVGALVRTAVQEGRAAQPGLPTGVCGEHGGDADSVHFFHDVGLDYVSCSPYRVPEARLEAARAALEPGGGPADG